MSRLRVIAATLIALVLFAWQDVLLWQRIVERGGLWQYSGTYHDGWRVMRDGLIVVGVLLLWPRIVEAVFYSSTLALFSMNGATDILYYWLDGRAVPDSFVWPCDAYHICIAPEMDIVPQVALWFILWFGLWGMLSITVILNKRLIWKPSPS